MIPEGYRVEETNERAMRYRVTYFKFTAERTRVYATARRIIPSYRLVVERITRNPFRAYRWEVVAYQNVLAKEGP